MQKEGAAATPTLMPPAEVFPPIPPGTRRTAQQPREEERDPCIGELRRAQNLYSRESHNRVAAGHANSPSKHTDGPPNEGQHKGDTKRRQKRRELSASRQEQKAIRECPGSTRSDAEVDSRPVSERHPYFGTQDGAQQPLEQTRGQQASEGNSRRRPGRGRRPVNNERLATLSITRLSSIAHATKFDN